ncbi:MAG: phosphoribosylamine--glycine ligase [Deltaproteobacteria bacterium]|nr:phosphoribosylamine--glycine ligase [Deltaproteobacteria bacterium]
MRVLIIGKGGREHALGWKISCSPLCQVVFVHESIAHLEESFVGCRYEESDHQSILSLCRELSIDLVVIGPEKPLVDGLADVLSSNSITVFGPRASGAKLEGSKSYARDFLNKYGIPTASGKAFCNLEDSLLYLHHKKESVVIKLDTLAAGKGVFIPGSYENSVNVLKKIYSKNPDEKIVIEDFLTGWELSVFAVSDGNSFILLPESQDNKRLLDGDKGPNTGGMGAVSPVARMTPETEENIQSLMGEIMKGLHSEKIDYRGLLYTGFMITEDGPRVLEFNCRFGDPETQPLLYNMDDDILPLLFSAARGNAGNQEIDAPTTVSVGVVCASENYPGGKSPEARITGLEKLADIKGLKVFHSGTVTHNGEYFASGGRILTVVGRSTDYNAAAKIAYEGISKLNFKGMQYRRDIGISSERKI